jgi:hypothetical protein
MKETEISKKEESEFFLFGPSATNSNCHKPTKSLKGKKRMTVYSGPILTKQERYLVAFTRQASSGKNPEKILICSEVPK